MYTARKKKTFVRIRYDRYVILYIILTFTY